MFQQYGILFCMWGCDPASFFMSLGSRLEGAHLTHNTSDVMRRKHKGELDQTNRPYRYIWKCAFVLSCHNGAINRTKNNTQKSRPLAPWRRFGCSTRLLHHPALLQQTNNHPKKRPQPKQLERLKVCRAIKSAMNHWEPSSCMSHEHWLMDCSTI